jgi:hypothetical protein
MKRPPKWKRFWLCCRWGIRGCRMVLLLVLLALIAGFIWFNQIGMPDFAKTLLQEELKQRGMDVEFQRMYWKWFRGIITEDLIIHPSKGRIGPSVFIQSADLDLDLEKLVTGELSVKAIELFQGSGRWLVRPTNKEPQTLTIDKLHTDIRFLPDDRWELTRFDAVIQGVHINAGGIITNASFARTESARVHVKPKESRQRRQAMEQAEGQIHAALEKFSSLKFATAPSLNVEFSADARLRGEINARISGNIATLDTPLATCRGVRINGHVTRAAATNAPAKASLSLSADSLSSDSLKTREARGFAFFTLTPNGDWSALWNTGLKDVTSRHGSADYISFEGNATPDPSAPSNHLATVSLKAGALNLGDTRVAMLNLTTSLEGSLNRRILENVQIKGSAESFVHRTRSAERLAFSISARTNHTVTATNLTAWQVSSEINANGFLESDVRVESARVGLRWDHPMLTIRDARFELDQGGIGLDATADVVSRQLDLDLESTAALDQIAPLLGPKNERYLNQYRFKKPPIIRAKASLRLPPGDLKSLRWKTDLEPLLNVAGRIEAGPGDYRGLAFDAAHTDVLLTNGLLILPNLLVNRPEGDARLAYTNNLATRDYSFGIDSGINPLSLGPLLGEGERKGLELLSFDNEMPHISGTLFGRWGDLDRTAFAATARLTNVALRGQHFDLVDTRASMTNGLILLRDTTMRRPEGRLDTPLVRIDTGAGRVHLTNVVSTLDFTVIPEVIGPSTARAVRAYEFPEAAEVVINGSVGTHRDAERDSDLHFDLRAKHFHWFKFNLLDTTARLDWVTNRLSITNLRSAFHGGSLAGWLDFDFDPPVGNDFRFDLTFKNAGIQSLIADLANPKNTLEGRLDGRLRVTDANTAYWDSWQGDGHASLTNGLLWQIPVFGLFSPVLNTLIPGLGDSRASDAHGTFTMTNSLILTRDLIIHSPPARLYYVGTADFDANIDARVEARLFKNKSLVGKLFDVLTSPITKIFEYKVGGTLGHPTSRPINELPNIILAPLKPLQVVGEILQGGNKPPAPPRKEK